MRLLVFVLWFNYVHISQIEFAMGVGGGGWIYCKLISSVDAINHVSA